MTKRYTAQSSDEISFEVRLKSVNVALLNVQWLNVWLERNKRSEGVHFSSVASSYSLQICPTLHSILTLTAKRIRSVEGGKVGSRDKRLGTRLTNLRVYRFDFSLGLLTLPA